jgi:tetratricopeptide (TPR) repeat protein
MKSMADEESILQHAMLLCRQRNLFAAEQIYLKILASKPARFSIRHLLMHFQQGRLDEARADMVATLDVNPDFAEAHANLAIALDRLDLSEESLKHHDRAAEVTLRYPTMKLYRQTTRGDWKDCFQRIGNDPDGLSSCS